MDRAGGKAAVIRALATIGFLILISAASILHLRPPGIDGDLGFATDAAMEHLKIIAQQPHPVGSPANRAVRKYVVDQLTKSGFEVDVQRAEMESRWHGRSYTVHNVLARLRGEGDGTAVALVAHYDSVHTGPGAADDGAAVAALIEVGRLLHAEGPFHNDLILLLTDGEEAGLLGAFAFVDEHDWFNEVGLVLNFEARGTSGASIMFETSPGNGWLVREYARVAPHPITSSLSVEVYRRMPNFTDFTAFLRADLAGMNFAFISTPENYHTEYDDLEHLDTGSLRHHGVQAMALARHFLRMDLTTRRSSDDAVFFVVPGLGVIHYPLDWALPLCLLPVGVLATLITHGLRSRKLRTRRILIAAAGQLLTMAVASGASYMMWLALKAINQSFNTNWMVAAFVSLAVAVTLALTGLMARRLEDCNLAVGACAWGAALAIFSSVWMPAASYLFVWPVLFSSLSLLVLLSSDELREPSVVRSATVNLLAVPSIVVILPVAYLAFVALGVQAGFALNPLAVLLVWSLLPQLRILARPLAWHCALALGSSSIISFIVAL